MKDFTRRAQICAGHCRIRVSIAIISEFAGESLTYGMIKPFRTSRMCGKSVQVSSYIYWLRRG